MGWYVHLSITFACDEKEGVAELAKSHLEKLDKEAPREAGWYLKDLTEGNHLNVGPKGGLSTWGIVSNHSRPDKIAEALKPFWEQLLKGKIEGGPLDFEHIIFFYEMEQSEQARCYEVYLENGKLILEHHDLPFCWGQF